LIAHSVTTNKSILKGDFSIRWEDVTSNNSLQQVAKLHCGIQVDKSIRVDLISARPSDIFSNMQVYVSYCAQDVSVTHDVFKRVFPLFRSSCPSPVTFAGVLTMGSSLLPVNEGWEDYVQHAEAKFRDLEQAVKTRLEELAEIAKNLMSGSAWKNDPWLSQLDWSPKKSRKRRADSIRREKQEVHCTLKWELMLIYVGLKLESLPPNSQVV
jgi:DNA polymerase gamma 1